MELVPQPLATLLRRVEREPRSTEDGAIFDLPATKMWRGTPEGLDLARTFHGHRAANVLGPAAGPQTQLAQNLALSYLAGARVLELKTVQILDQLEIPRPCIDATNIGFNVEWSQELRIAESRDEYAKAALLIAALRRMGLPEGLPARDQDFLLDLSLGYDLAGVSSEAITTFVREMLDASSTLDRLLDELPPDLAHFRDLEVPKRLISSVTLSTFHGCPAHEIEKIARYLLESLGVHVVVKLNPTLLGFEAVEALLHEHLGYRELKIRRSTFENDLQEADARAMIARLRAVAHARGLSFGVKLTNTLVVDNHKTFFQAPEMYLSGQPLHVLSSALYAQLRRALPIIGPNGEPPVAYSFSAGIDQHNFPDAVAADLCPVTTCTDLLRPGGYGRLPKYLENLAQKMRASGAADLDAFILRAHGEARAALTSSTELILAQAAKAGLAVERAALERVADEVEAGRAPAEALATHLDAATALLVRPLWVHEAGTLGARRFADAAQKDPRYRRAANTKTPKKIGSALELFDCVNCDKCVPVCPNDANFVYQALPLALSAPSFRIEDGRATELERVAVAIESDHQLATYVDACNGCGNCDVFCPEDGGPYVMKPHFFGSRAAFEASPGLDGFFLESTEVIVGRVRGRTVRLALERETGRVAYEDEGGRLSARFEAGTVMLESFEATEPRRAWEIRGADLVTLASLLEGVLSTVNPVSSAFAERPARAPHGLARLALAQ